MSEISKGNPLDQNRSGKVKIKTTNFPIHQHLYGTYRFGEMGVLGAWNGLAKDKVTMQQIIDVNTYTLKAPLLTPITMNRTYIQVPRMAMLPNAWDKLFINPKIGSDIDASRFGTSVDKNTWNNFMISLVTNINEAIQRLEDEDESAENYRTELANLIKAMFTAELIFSNGSLCNALGMHFNRCFDNENKMTFDETFEHLWSKGLLGIGYLIAQDEETNEYYQVIINWTATVAPKSSTVNYTILTLNQWAEKWRDGQTFKITRLVNNTGTTLNTLTALKTATQALNPQEFGILDIKEYAKPVDIAALWAYQMACAEFFTNDNVDYIYNAELYRQYIGSLIQKVLNQDGEHIDEYAYNYNGQKIMPDWLSAIYFNIMRQNINYYKEGEAYIYALFKYNRTLKYKDYFTGARTRPIAIGNTNVEVNDDIVSIIDVVKNIQKQRFLNVVNKIPRDLKGYTKGIFGTDIAPDWHNPLYLATISESIYGQETENTGEAQLSQPQTRTSVLKNQGNKLQLNFKLDRNSIVIGLVWFDIPRAYSKGVKRWYADVDRFDWFNPYMQYTGDQEIYMSELDASAQDATFGYTGAYMDKKQDYNEAFGGFIDALKGWTFLDRYVSGEYDNGVYEQKTIGPDFIRSKPSELDRFYISLSGHSMSNYFHFILDIETHYNARRAMAYNPQILA